jgi:hypothetical protein
LFERARDFREIAVVVLAVERQAANVEKFEGKIARRERRERMRELLVE